MKVLFISRRFYPEIMGGGQISGLKIAEAVRNKGIEVTVLTFINGNKTTTEDYNGIKIIRKPISKLKLLPKLSNLDYMYYQMAKTGIKTIKNEKPDIIHLLNFESIPLSSMIYKKKYKIPIVATVNSPLFGCFVGNGLDHKGDICLKCSGINKFLSSLKKWGKIKGLFYYIYSFWYMNILLKVSYRSVDKFFLVSNSMSNFLNSMGVSSNKLCTVHNPIDNQKKIKNNLKKNLNLENKKIILYAGRITENKGIDLTIKSMKYFNNICFLILGRKNEYSKKLIKLIKKHKLEKKVKFIGFINQLDLPKYYSITDIVINPCKYPDPLSRMLIEAESYGIPLIASNRGGNSEIINNNKNGFILKSFSEKEIAKRIQDIFNGKLRKVKEYSMEKINNEFSMNHVGNEIKKQYIKLLQK